MKRRQYKTKFRPARRHFDIVMPDDDDDEYEVILGAGTDKPQTSDAGCPSDD